MSYIPNGDREFLAWAQNFLTVLTEFKAEANITDEQLQDIADGIAAFNNSLGLSDQKKLESKAATGDKNAARDLIEDRLRSTAEFVRVQPAIVPTMLTGMGLRPHDTQRTRQTPVTPQDLVAESNGDGSVHLDWDSGGNTSGVQYVIEVQVGENGPFTLVDVVTRRSYRHEDPPEGTLTYRVRARRNGETSPASNLATVRI